MSRTKRFIGGVSFGYVNQILLTLTCLWLTPSLPVKPFSAPSLSKTA